MIAFNCRVMVIVSEGRVRDPGYAREDDGDNNRIARVQTARIAQRT